MKIKSVAFQLHQYPSLRSDKIIQMSTTVIYLKHNFLKLKRGLILKTGRKLLKFKNTICDKKSAELELKKYVPFIGLVSEKGRLSIYFDVGTTFYFLIFWFFFPE